MSTKKAAPAKVKPVPVALVDKLQQAAWIFGNRAFDGSCCEGLSFLEYQALSAAAMSTPCSIKDVGSAIKFSKSGATRIINRLERKGLVERRRAHADGRVCCVVLTRRGRAVTAKILASYAVYVSEVLKDLDVRSLETIARALERLLAAVRPPGRNSPSVRT